MLNGVISGSQLLNACTFTPANFDLQIDAFQSARGVHEPSTSSGLLTVTAAPAMPVSDPSRSLMIDMRSPSPCSSARERDRARVHELDVAHAVRRVHDRPVLILEAERTGVARRVRLEVRERDVLGAHRTIVELVAVHRPRRVRMRRVIVALAHDERVAQVRVLAANVAPMRLSASTPVSTMSEPRSHAPRTTFFQATKSCSSAVTAVDGLLRSRRGV